MIYVDESTVKIGGVILPGLFKSMEIKSSALIEEQEVEGRSQKPKQAIGYEDAKIVLELILEDSPEQTKFDKLKIIQNIFRKSGQGKPSVYEIVNEHTSIRNITKVILKDISSKEQSNKSEIYVNIELWEYVSMTITAKKVSNTSKSKSTNKGSNSSKSNTKSNGLSEDYTKYLGSNRGTAPKLSNKTSKSPAVDDDYALNYKNKLGDMPY